jgi:prephenate dehydrogenase
MTIAAVGLCLIGGSLMIDLRKRGFADKIIGVDSNLQHRNIAQLCGLVDETDTLNNAVDRSDLIILSTPVDTNCEMLPEILDRIAGTSKVVTDMGSRRKEQKYLNIMPAGDDMSHCTLWPEQNFRALWLPSAGFLTIRM